MAENQANRAVTVALIGAAATVAAAVIGVLAGRQQGEATANQSQPTVTVVTTTAGPTVTVYEPSPSEESSANPASSADPIDTREVRWSGQVLLNENGLDFDEEVPRDGSSNDFYRDSGDIRNTNYRGAAIVTWTDAKAPTYQDCLLKLNTESLPRHYIYRNPKPGLTVCFSTPDRDHIGVFKVKQLKDTGIVMDVKIWVNDDGG